VSVKTLLIILDLDGTLADTLDDLTLSLNVMREEFGLSPLERQVVRGMVGKGARNLVQLALPGHSKEEVERGVEILLAHNETHLFDSTRTFCGVVDTLASLAAHGHTLALLSNKNESLCRKLLEHFGIDQHFSAVAGADTMPCRKPSPEPILRLMDMLGRLPAETVMVGDSINDVAAGRGAGVVTVGCTYGYGELHELTEASFRIDSFAELLRLPFLAVREAVGE
jgi:phosphoglycolate phosphatase